jgi:hypothetical protein
MSSLTMILTVATPFVTLATRAGSGLPTNMSLDNPAL